MVWYVYRSGFLPVCLPVYLSHLSLCLSRCRRPQSQQPSVVLMWDRLLMVVGHCNDTIQYPLNQFSLEPEQFKPVLQLFKVVFKCIRPFSDIINGWFNWSNFFKLIKVSLSSLRYSLRLLRLSLRSLRLSCNCLMFSKIYLRLSWSYWGSWCILKFELFHMNSLLELFASQVMFHLFDPWRLTSGFPSRIRVFWWENWMEFGSSVQTIRSCFKRFLWSVRTSSRSHPWLLELCCWKPTGSTR